MKVRPKIADLGKDLAERAGGRLTAEQAVYLAAAEALAAKLDSGDVPDYATAPLARELRQTVEALTAARAEEGLKLTDRDLQLALERWG